MHHQKKGKYRISGKNLGDLARLNCCERCFWLKTHASNKIPFQIFPGIFSSIDSFTKKVIHSFIDKNGIGPTYLREIGDVTGYIDPPHNSKFHYTDPSTMVTLSGDADGILKLANNTLAIVDYKTAKFTKNQDSLLPVYQVQLNAYAIISEHLGLGKVSKLALIYMEPQTESYTELSRYSDTDGFYMDFKAYTMDVAIEPEKVHQLLRKARQLLDGPIPAPNGNCTDCHKLIQLYDLFPSDQLQMPC